MNSEFTPGRVFVDSEGEEHAVEAAVMVDGGRLVFLGDAGFAPEVARRLGRELIEAADVLDQALLSLVDGGHDAG